MDLKSCEVNNYHIHLFESNSTVITQCAELNIGPASTTVSL